MIVSTASETLANLLAAHPRVSAVEKNPDPEGALMEFTTNRLRRILSLNQAGLGGLVELMDNNPLVCADEAMVPDALSTLLLIGFGPLAQAGIVVEPPVIQTNAPLNLENVEVALASVDWADGALFDPVEDEMGGIYAVTVLAKVRNPGDWDDLDDLFEERYTRSLFVRRNEVDQWGPSLVLGKSYALYRLRLTPDDDASLLTVQVIADPKGKCGDPQIIHMMNVMCGFEESLGIPID